jgi:hypothetical protein
MNETE